MEISNILQDKDTPLQNPVDLKDLYSNFDG